jgi:hypothetical protein
MRLRTPYYPVYTRMKKMVLFAGLLLAFVGNAKGQTPVPMASQPSFTYTEDFADIANWTNDFAAGTGASRFKGLSVNASGSIPSGTRITTASISFVTGSSGGVQRGSAQSVATTSIALLSTGSSDNSSSTGFDFYLDFSSTDADSLKFDATTVFNSTGNRVGTLRVYWTTDGSTFTEVTGTNLPYSATNNVAGTASVKAKLPSGLNGSATGRLRFYYHNGSGGSTGSRPKISIDNLTVTATTASGPKAEPDNGATMFSAVASKATITLTWTDATGGQLPDGYLVLANTTGTFSNPVDGTDPSSDSDLTDGTATVKIPHGSQTTAFSGLASQTTYYFKIFSYTNSSTNIDYNLADAVTANASTLIFLIEETFTTNTSGDFTATSVAGATDVWTFSSGYAAMNGFGDEDDEDWIVAGPINLDIHAGEKLNFISREAFDGPNLQVYYSNTWTGSGTPTTSYFSELAVTLNDASSTSTFSAWTAASEIDLSALTGSRVYIAFRYTGTAATAEHWQIDDIYVTATSVTGYAQNITGSAGWRMLSTPVSTTYSTFLGSIWTQGMTGSDHPGASAANANIRTLNDQTWEVPSNMTNTISAGSGFIVNVFEDDDYDTEGIQGGFPKTLSVSGTENAAPVAINPISGSGKYTLAGNPFASTIDWDLVARTNVSNTIYVYDPTYTATTDDGAGSAQSVGAYRAWNGSVGGQTDGLVAPFQGFLVQATGDSPTISFEADDKTSGATFRGKETRIEKLRLIVSHKDGGSNDAWIQFSPNGNVGFDAWDGWKLQPFTSTYLLLNSGYANGYPLDINHLPVLSERMEIPFSMETTLNGSYSLRIENGLSSAATFEVLDTETGSRVRLTADNSYTFDVAKASKAVDAAPGRQPLQVKATTSPRFVLIVTPGEATSNEEGGRITELSLEQNFPNPFNPATTIRFNLPSASTVKLSVYDATGRLVDVVTSGMKSAGAHTVNWNAAKQASGIYLLRLEANGQLLTRKMTLLK